MIPQFKNKELLRLAFTHRSASKKSNERLEFLGDSVLSFLTSKHLYELFPKKSEGELTMLRSLLVNKRTLSLLSKNLGFGKMLILSASEDEASGRQNESILEDCFESFLAALFLDQGLDGVQKFLEKNLFPLVSKVEDMANLKDYKSLLQEKIQAKGHTSPIYHIIKEEGPDHAKTFMAEVLDTDNQIGTGVGKTKQEAEIEAAKNALSCYN